MGSFKLPLSLDEAKSLPAVYYIARQLQRRLSADLVELILLLWLYSNPHETRRRTLASLRHVLKHTPEFQQPDGRTNVTEDELNQITLGAVQRLKKQGYVTVRGVGQDSAQITLSEKGIEFIRSELTPESLQFLEGAGHLT